MKQRHRNNYLVPVRRKLAKLDLFLLATILVYVVVMALIGNITGNGYSFTMKEIVILPHPMKIGVDNYTDPLLHPLIRVWGRAYTRELVVADQEPVELVKPLVSGNLTCQRVPGTEHLYKCIGRGYVYRFAGLLSEFVERGNTSKYFYYGSGVRLLIYNYNPAIFGVIISQIVAVLYSYSYRARYGRSNYPRYRVLLQLVAATSLATGALLAVKDHPWFLGPLRVAIIVLVSIAVVGVVLLPIVVEKIYNWVEDRRSM